MTLSWSHSTLLCLTYAKVTDSSSMKVGLLPAKVDVTHLQRRASLLVCTLRQHLLYTVADHSIATSPNFHTLQLTIFLAVLLGYQIVTITSVLLGLCWLFTGVEVLLGGSNDVRKLVFCCWLTITGELTCCNTGTSTGYVWLRRLPGFFSFVERSLCSWFFKMSL